MPSGIIMKALSGFYYVSAGAGLIECRARGKFRRDGISPMVGDLVSYELTGEEKGYISSIAERKNYLSVRWLQTWIIS